MMRRNTMLVLAGLLMVLPLNAKAERQVGSGRDVTNQCLLHLETGIVYLQTRQPDLAIDEFRKALRLNPRLAVAKCQIGYAQLAKGDWAEGEREFSQALELDPEYGNALYGMTLVSSQKKDMDKAISYLEKSIKAGPALADRYLQLGVFRLAKRDAAGAMTAWSEGLKADPKNLQLMSNLGGLLAMQGKVDEGIAQLNNALAIAPNFAQAHNNLGIALMQGKKDFNAAEKEFSKALVIAPNYGDAKQNLGVSLFLQKKYADASSAFSDIVKAQPKAARPHYYLAAINSITNRSQDAVDQLGKAISLDGSLRESAKKEPSFDNIKSLEGFKKLISST